MRSKSVVANPEESQYSLDDAVKPAASGRPAASELAGGASCKRGRDIDDDFLRQAAGR
ncbi:hypothetical protein T484DRAFT_1905651 [Baffinella frigidus]|nr:hypothetical protein T484DRAFT_1905651 [Cryptophyta sp. CCMP2293]